MLVQKYFETRKKLLEKHLDQYLTTDEKIPGDLLKAMRYAVFGDAKRLRPLLMFSAYEMLKKRKNVNSLLPLMPAACALEMVHAASLIHDDLPFVDDSDERRGLPSCHKKFDDATAILAGDALMTKAFEILATIPDKEKAVKCIQTLAKAISTRGMIGGQTVDILAARKRIRINVLRYIHLKKTGALLQASMDFASIMFDAEDNIAVTLGNYALNLGLAYQIIDDILDEVGAFETLGKEPGQDIRNKKATYPGLIGLDKSKKNAEKLLTDSFNMIKSMPNNEVLVEYINMIKERLP